MSLLVIKAALVVALAISIIRCFFGTPAPSASRRMSSLLLGLSVCCYVLAAEALLTGEPTLAAVLCVLGIEGLCLAAWTLRGGGWDEGDDDDDEGPEPEGPGPIDWNAFDRARASWRPREPVA